MWQKLLIIISNNQFWVLDTNYSHFSPKKAKKTNFRIRILVPPTTKMLQKPLFLPFQAPKRVWEALSQIFGKSQIFSGHLDHKKVPKTRLLFGAGIKSPPSCRVKKSGFLKGYRGSRVQVKEETRISFHKHHLKIGFLNYFFFSDGNTDT